MNDARSWAGDGDVESSLTAPRKFGSESTKGDFGGLDALLRIIFAGVPIGVESSLMALVFALQVGHMNCLLFVRIGL